MDLVSCVLQSLVFQIKPAWKAKCSIFKAIVAGFRGKVAKKKLGHLAFQVLRFGFLGWFLEVQFTFPQALALDSAGTLRGVNEPVLYAGVMRPLLRSQDSKVKIFIGFFLKILTHTIHGTIVYFPTLLP